MFTRRTLGQLVRWVFCLTTLVLAGPPATAQEPDIERIPLVFRAGLLVHPSEFASDVAACSAAFEKFCGSDKNAVFLGTTACKNGHPLCRQCRWSGCIAHAPDIYRHCPEPYLFSSKWHVEGDYCVKRSIKAPDRCDAAGAGVTTSHPIQLITGSKLFDFEDFRTEDGRLLLARSYASLGSGVGRVGTRFADGMVGGWQFNFGLHLALDNSFGSNGTIAVESPEGTSHRFKRNADGTFSPHTYYSGSNRYMPETRFKVKFVGTWPTNLNLVDDQVTTWDVTDSEDRVWRLETSAVPNPAYRIARPTKVTWRDGYAWTYAYGPLGQLLSITDSFGRVIRFDWLVETLPSTTTHTANAIAIRSAYLPDGSRIDYTYDSDEAPSSAGLIQADRLKSVTWRNAAGTLLKSQTFLHEHAVFKKHITGIVDALGARVRTVAYDTSGRATLSEGQGGADRTTVAYATESTRVLLRTVTNALGKTAVYRFESTITGPNDFRLTKIDGVASPNCVASTGTVTYDKDAGNRPRFIASTTDEEGRVTSYVRDNLGRPSSVTRGSGTADAVTTTYAYHPTLNVPATITEPGRTATYGWNSAGQLTSVTETDTTTHTVPYATRGQTRTWSFTYGTAGLLTAVNGPLTGAGDTVTYGYGANGTLTSVTNELGQITTLAAHNGRGQPTRVTDANGVVTTLAYDGLGRVTSVIVNDGRPDAATTRFTYDIGERIRTVTRPDGSALTFDYTPTGRVASIRAADNESIAMTYDLMGNVTSRSVRSATGAVVTSTQQVFDELGRLLRSVGASGRITSYAYDRTDNLKSITDPRAQTTRFAYDSLSRLTREIDPENATVSYRRDSGAGAVPRPRRPPAPAAADDRRDQRRGALAGRVAALGRAGAGLAHLGAVARAQTRVWVSPSTETAWPEMVRPRGLARNTIMSASCSGRIISLMEACASAASRISAADLPAICALASNTRRMRSPSTTPGRMALTRMPKSPSSRDSVLVKPTTPHLAAA